MSFLTLSILFRIVTQLEGPAWTAWMKAVPPGVGPVPFNHSKQREPRGTPAPSVELLLGLDQGGGSTERSEGLLLNTFYRKVRPDDE